MLVFSWINQLRCLLTCWPTQTSHLQEEMMCPLKLCLCGKGRVRSSWLYGGPDDPCAERSEASELSSLKPQLDGRGVPLYSVVKENIGTEINDFRPYFNGEIFLDQKKCFYGPKQRRMKASGIARFGVMRNLLQVWRKGYHGNRKGEGFILGGLYVIGPGNQGILLQHHEKEFGDKADLSKVIKAVSRIQTTEEIKEN